MPVPENLLKEAQQAAEEQKSMPGIEMPRHERLKIPASLEKMFQQAKDEQEVEKLAKEGEHKVLHFHFIGMINAYLCYIVSFSVVHGP